MYFLLDNLYTNLNVYRSFARTADDGPTTFTVYSRDDGILSTCMQEFFTFKAWGWDRIP